VLLLLLPLLLPLQLLPLLQLLQLLQAVRDAVGHASLLLLVLQAG
jgi:hypothetical protein